MISILTGGEPKRKGQRSPWQNQYLWDVKMAQSVATTQMSKRIFVPVFSGVERAEEQLQKAIKGDSVLYKMCELQTLNTEDEDWMMELEDILTGQLLQVIQGHSYGGIGNGSTYVELFPISPYNQLIFVLNEFK